METEKKLNFFQRIFVAIFKLEEYGVFLLEKFSDAIKYFLLLVLVLTIVVGIANGYTSYKMIEKGYEYIHNELPNFTLENNTLKFEKEVDAFDHDYDFSFIVNTDYKIEDKESSTYINKIRKGDQGICLLQDGFVYSVNQFDGDTELVEEPVTFKYSDLTKEYTDLFSSKDELVKYIDENPAKNVAVAFSLVNIVVGYFANIISIALDVAMITIIGYCVSRLFAKVFLNVRAIFLLAIYSMTLPLFITMIYAIVNTLTGFEIVHFSLMYELIGCVYLVAAIYMIKYDLIKQNEELSKIIMVENQIRKEKEEEEDRKAEEELKRREEQKKKEKERKKNKEDEVDAGEPDGSEI